MFSLYLYKGNRNENTFILLIGYMSINKMFIMYNNKTHINLSLSLCQSTCIVYILCISIIILNNL